MELCGKERCTGCGACVERCVNNCIDYVYDEYGTKYAKIDHEKCTNCELCRHVCHVESKMEFVFPMKVYAAWSSDTERYSQAASGGVATEIYRYALKYSLFVMGTCFEREKGVFYREIQTESDIQWARDSKYVYSDMSSCFGKYEEQLLSRRKCIFIGLPCQTAALKTYLEGKRIKLDGNLICIDLICHGVPNWQFLNEHLKFIESRKKTVVRKVTFRNPNSDFLMKCYDGKDHLIYRRGMHEDDTYYRAFSVNLDFRDSCYRCRYARNERISDLTIGDYSGLGRLWDYSGNTCPVSVIMVNSGIGQKLVCSMKADRFLEVIERPLAEPASAQGNPQLRHPSMPHKNRKRFLKYYKETKKFEYAVKKALLGLFVVYYVSFPMVLFKKLMIRYLPVELKEEIKKRLR